MLLYFSFFLYPTAFACNPASSSVCNPAPSLVFANLRLRWSLQSCVFLCLQSLQALQAALESERENAAANEMAVADGKKLLKTLRDERKSLKVYQTAHRNARHER